MQGQKQLRTESLINHASTGSGNLTPTNPREDKACLVPIKIATEMSLPQRAREPRPYIYIKP